jgi:hypothetical protein
LLPRRCATLLAIGLLTLLAIGLLALLAIRRLTLLAIGLLTVLIVRLLGPLALRAVGRLTVRGLAGGSLHRRMVATPAHELADDHARAVLPLPARSPKTWVGVE